MPHLIEPGDLLPDTIEEIEKLTLRSIYQAVLDFGFDTWRIFYQSPDKVNDIAEDLTRELMDRLSGYYIDQRLFGNVDYRTARYIFLPEFGVRQALFVDSKAEKNSSSATLQMSQLSLRVKQVRQDLSIDEAGKLPVISSYGNLKFLTSTMLVHYHYDDIASPLDRATLEESKSIEIPTVEPAASAEEGSNEGETGEEERIPPGSPLHHVLKHITVAAIPNGLLQDRYNPTELDGIWNIGRNAPNRGEDFRVRVAFNKLKGKRSWGVQRIAYDAEAERLIHTWED